MQASSHMGSFFLYLFGNKNVGATNMFIPVRSTVVMGTLDGVVCWMNLLLTSLTLCALCFGFGRDRL